MKKSDIIQKETNRQIEKAEHNNFISRNYGLNVVMMWVIYPISSLFSALTQGTHLYLNFIQTFNNINIALFLTIMIAGLIEIGKFLLGKATLEDINSGVFSENWAHKRAFILKAVGATLFFGFSIFLSISGAPTIAEHYKTKSNPIALINTDSINQAYDLQIVEQNEVISKGEKMTWKGKVVSDGRKLINTAEANKTLIEQNRSTALFSAQEENKSLQTAYTAKIDNSGFWFTNLTGIGEVICFICLLFWGNYENGIGIEIKQVKASPTPRPTQSQVPGGFEKLIELINQKFPDQQSNQGRKNDFQPKRQIGFNRGNKGQNSNPVSKLKGESKPESQNLKTETEKPESLETKETQLESEYFQKLKVIPVSKLETDCRNHYRRSFQAARESTREDNKRKYLAEKNQLELYGYQVLEISETSLEIIPPN